MSKLESYINTFYNKEYKKHLSLMKSLKVNDKSSYLELKKNGQLIIGSKKLNYEIIGTYNTQSKFFRHSWANDSIQKKLSLTSRKLKKLNKPLDTFIFTYPILNGKKWSDIISMICVKESKSKGYIKIKYSKTIYLFLLIKH